MDYGSIFFFLILRHLGASNMIVLKSRFSFFFFKKCVAFKFGISKFLRTVGMAELIVFDCVIEVTGYNL